MTTAPVDAVNQEAEEELTRPTERLQLGPRGTALRSWSWTSCTPTARQDADAMLVPACEIPATFLPTSARRRRAPWGCGEVPDQH